MPVVSAAGETGPPLFISKGRQLFPCRNVVGSGTIVPETYPEYLPRGSVIACREEFGGVDSENSWIGARNFSNP